MTKACLEPCRIILVSPEWRNAPWKSLLQKVTFRTVELPPKVLVFVLQWGNKWLPRPRWATRVTFVDTIRHRVPITLLDPLLVSFVKKNTQGWGLQELDRLMENDPEYHTMQKRPDSPRDERMREEYAKPSPQQSEIAHKQHKAKEIHHSTSQILKKNGKFLILDLFSGMVFASERFRKTGFRVVTLDNSPNCKLISLVIF